MLKAWKRCGLPSSNLTLLSTWDPNVQDEAVELFARRELFPSQKEDDDRPTAFDQLEADDPTDKQGDEIDDHEEISSDALIAALLQDNEDVFERALSAFNE